MHSLKAGSRIGISLLAYSPHRLAGAGTYTMGLAQALTARAPSRYTVFVPPQCEALWRASLPPDVGFVVCGPDPDQRVLRVGFEQIRLPKVALQRGVETIFFPHLFAPRWREPRAVITVYDLLLLIKKTDFAWHKRLYHHWAYRRVATRASHIVTISEFCRRDIANRLAIPGRRISVVPPGVDSEFLAPEDHMARRRGDLPERYVLTVAGRYPHKRLPIVLEAFVSVSRHVTDLDLVVAGTHAGDGNSPALLQELAQRHQIAARVHLLPRLERAEMPELFRRAAVLVSASEFEGFGIPILEAMAVGCPVAASPAEGVLEVLGGHGWVAEDFSAEALASAVQKALAARQFTPGVLSQAMDRAWSHYSWATSAAKLDAVLAAGLSSTSGGRD